MTKTHRRSGYLVNVGALIQRAREARGISQLSLSRALGVNSSYVSTVERGLGKGLSPEQIRRFAKVLKVDNAERERWMAAAGHLPDDLHQLLVNHPDAWDQVRALLKTAAPAAASTATAKRAASSARK